MGRPPTDDGLVALARGGDADAYARLVREHQEVAFRVAFLIAADAAEAEDAVQEAFVKAHGALGRFRVGEPFRPWLLAIVANEARNRRTSATRRERLLGRAAEQRPAVEASSPASPETVLLATERREALLGALAALDDRDRDVIVCRYLLDLSERESASVLDCRPGTVKSRLSRALDRVRTLLDEEVRHHD